MKYPYCSKSKSDRIASNTSAVDLIQMVKLFVRIGIERVKITGGEPLLMEGFPVISSIAGMKNIKDLSFTTNGILLQHYLDILKDIRIVRFNISIDTLKKNKFEKFYGSGSYSSLLYGIKEAVKLGYAVKLNTVIAKGLNLDEVLDLVKFSADYNIRIRFIELMPVKGN